MASQTGTLIGSFILGIGFLIAAFVLVLGGFGALLPSIGICAVSGLVGLAVIGASVPKKSAKPAVQTAQSIAASEPKAVCRYCGMRNLIISRKCAACERPMPHAAPAADAMARGCKNCGAPLSADEKICTGCGKPEMESDPSLPLPGAPVRMAFRQSFKPDRFPLKVQVRFVLDGPPLQTGPWVEAEADDQEEWIGALEFVQDEFRKKHQRIRFGGSDLDLRREEAWAQVQPALRLENRTG